MLGDLGETHSPCIIQVREREHRLPLAAENSDWVTARDRNGKFMQNLTRRETFRRARRIDTETQRMSLSAVSTPELVHASNPGRGVEKKAKN